MRREEKTVFYQAEDCDKNRRQVKHELKMMLLCVLPFLALGAAGFIVRNEILAIIGFAAACALAIFLTDLRLMPVVRYGRFLNEIMSGLRHDTVGCVVSFGTEPVYENGVDFREMIVNIYEDMSPDGERRFLLEYHRDVPKELIGQNVKVTSHGSYVMGLEKGTSK